MNEGGALGLTVGLPVGRTDGMNEGGALGLSVG